MSLEPKKTWQSVWWWFLKKSTAKETLGKSWKVYTLYFNGFARVAWHEVLALVPGSWWMAGEMSERWGYSWGKSLYNLNIIEICYDMLLCRKKKKRVMSKGIRFLRSKFKKTPEWLKQAIQQRCHRLSRPFHFNNFHCLMFVISITKHPLKSTINLGGIHNPSKYGWFTAALYQKTTLA